MAPIKVGNIYDPSSLGLPHVFPAAPNQDDDSAELLYRFGRALAASWWLLSLLVGWAVLASSEKLEHFRESEGGHSSLGLQAYACYLLWVEPQGFEGPRVLSYLQTNN